MAGIKIDMTHDVIVPVAVTVAHIGLRAWDDKRRAAGATFMYEPAMGIVGMVGGFAMQKMGWAPEIGNSIALTNAVSGLGSIYDWGRAAISGGTTGIRGGARVARRISAPVVNPLTQYEKSGI